MSANNQATSGDVHVEDPPEDWDASSGNEANDDDDTKAGAEATVSNNDSDSTKATSEDDSGDEDGSNETPGSKVLNKYRRLLSRRVDLVGDYAGDELFLIEGDSMLLRCFSDDLLDFSPGFQMLHAVYNVEHLLHNLVKRKCNFHIVFFDSNRQLCIPSSAKDEDHVKYYLAREAIIRHLQAGLAKSQPGIAVKNFDSYVANDFVNYLSETGPYFVMMHDGAEAAQRKDKHVLMNEAGSVVDDRRVVAREMILHFLGKGYNVALINGLEWRDTKIMTMVLETKHRANLVFKPQLTAMNERGSDASAEVAKVESAAGQMTSRQLLAVLAVSNLLKDPPKSLGASAVARLSCVFLLHAALLQHLPLAARRFKTTENAAAQLYLRAISTVSERLLRGTAKIWQRDQTDLSDYIDGRLFLQLSEGVPRPSDAVGKTLASLLRAVEALTDKHLSPEELPKGPSAATNGIMEQTSHSEDDLAVLPFSNPVFDKHLESVRLRIDDAAGGADTAQSHRIFQELTHWHNAKKPLIQKGPPTPQQAKQAFWAAKREQLFMAEMRTYAASLTNAIGKSLEPETIIVGASRPSSKPASGAASPADSEAEDIAASSAKGKPGAKKGGVGGKTAQKNAGKQAMLAQIAKDKAKKEGSASDKVVGAWSVVCKNIEADSDVRSRYRKAKDYLANIKSQVREVIEAEVQLYLVNCVLQYWIDACRRKEQTRRLEVTALIWNLAGQVMQSKSLTKTIVGDVQLTIETLNLPPLPKSAVPEGLVDRKLAFTFALPTKVESVAVKVPSNTFQLTYAGPYLERSFDSKPDSRVEFNPDGWQRKVLDGIDANQSVFVVAPTSAGKTFISFYAMRKVLESSEDGVLVYVAPTKALVNQIAAEIQARYSKNFKHGGKSVWAIHTRDYRINNPTGCQVLVTVPHVLQIMLLAPSNANSWSSRVRRIIFDEVHSIGQAEDGVVWEQLLLMAPCPIIALSATVGNPDEFSSWLTDTQKAIGIDLVTVQHPYRYSDLRKYFYVPPKKFTFHGIPEKASFGTLGLDGLVGFNHVHPVGVLVDRSRGAPDDLSLEPRDCLELWQAMNKAQTKEYPVSAELSPTKALPIVCRKMDILMWEKGLKDLLREWIADRRSPYEAVLRELETSFRNTHREEILNTGEQSGVGGSVIDIKDPDDLIQTTLPMLCRLNAQEGLPAILFNYDRFACERIANAVLEQLRESELTQRKTGARWAKTLERWEEWKKVQEKNAKTRASAKKGKGQDEDRGSKLDQARDAAETGISQWDNFNPDAPIDGYHFADYTKVQLSELEIFVRQLGRRGVDQYLIDALQRGVGVHHAGMNRKYRQIVEILFRKGFLRVIVATGTLALGINMPCKTVVFSGDSVFLTALNYRQCAGRAGRRGFDLLGNVVFQGISREKVCRLISSRLPSLNGHFPMTTTLVLRLFTLLHESKGSKYAVGAINALLSQPRLYMGGPSFKDQTMHHLRFSIEYLRRQHLLGTNGAPLNFAGLVNHLYFTENSSFAFHALMKEGYFHDLCGRINRNEKDTLETLMLVMGHLFNRVYCKQSDAEYRENVVKPSSSIVFMPPLPKRAAEILHKHNEQTLAVYRTYVETFVDQHVHSEDRTLPLTGLTAGGSDSNTECPPHQGPVKLRSPFIALSGASDHFTTIHDLCAHTRSGIFLEEAVIPFLSSGTEEDTSLLPLNAWLLDFFKHGDIHTLERANGILRSDVWFMLNDFSLVLATIITSLLNFLKLKEGTDMDMLDVLGDLDIHDEAEDNEAAAASEETQSDISGPSQADSAVALPEHLRRPTSTGTAKKKTAAKNTESWEEVADAEDSTERTEARKAANAARLAEETEELMKGAAGGLGKEDLKDVLKAFQRLHAEFNIKFRAMWA